MVDVVAASAFKIAYALKDISPHFSDHIKQCAEAKIESELFRDALVLILNACKDVNSPDRKVREEITKTVCSVFKIKDND